MSLGRSSLKCIVGVLTLADAHEPVLAAFMVAGALATSTIQHLFSPACKGGRESDLIPRIVAIAVIMLHRNGRPPLFEDDVFAGRQAISIWFPARSFSARPIHQALSISVFSVTSWEAFIVAGGSSNGEDHCPCRQRFSRKFHNTNFHFFAIESTI